jgi:dUTP pyrophosphatase
MNKKDFKIDDFLGEIKKAAEELSSEVKNVMDEFKTERNRGFEVVIDKHRKFPNETIILPTRGSKYSAGYDLYSNETVTLQPNESHVFWFDVKVYMRIGEVFEIYPRSSISIKKNLILKNSVGIIDSDYYSNESNDGNMASCFINIGTTPITIEKGERISQGIFKKFYEADSGNTDKERTGGIGSSNK